MNTVPTMISTKDLDYIKDMLNWNFIATKKINHYLGNITDPEVQSIATKVSEMHKKHYNTVLNILK